MTDSSKLVYLLGTNHQDWSYETDYVMFITPEIIANQIVHLADEHFGGLIDKVVWDMFAGIGTDAIRLAKISGKIICTELNTNTYLNMLKNIETQNVSNIDVINGDCTDHIGKIHANIIYFDPPWGDTFRSGEPFDFRDVIIGGRNVVDLALEMQKHGALIIKAPYACDSFEEVFNKDDILSIFTFSQQKLKYLFVKKSRN